MAICWKPRKNPVLLVCEKQAVKMHRVMRTISREVVVPTLSVGRLTPQRLHAELLETMFERLAKRVSIATL